MGHIAELIFMWAAFGFVIALIAGAAGFGIRALRATGWSTTTILEGAFASGAVLGFVALVFYEMFWR